MHETTPQPTPVTQQFAPTLPHGTMESASYGPVFKGIALVLLAAAGLWAFQMHQMATRTQSAIDVFSWLWLPWGLMAYTVWFVVTGTTRLSSTAIEQSWMWTKRIELDNLAYAKVIRLRGLEWLLAPRLYTKSFSGKLFIFYAASPAMLDEFKRLETALAAARDPR
ncbi:MAG: hypothetical protein QE265_09270 [Rhodoferax sp.]|nr:hypothetical protein [Rhodoferax sp.]